MTPIAVVGCVGMLVVFVLLKGRSTKILSDLRLQYSSLVSEERRLRHEREQAAIMEESAEAMQNQAEADVEKFGAELKQLTGQVEEIEAVLPKPRAEDEDQA